MKWMFMPLLRYADFSGRSRRLEYWMFTLFFFLVVFAIVAVAMAMGGATTNPATELPISGMWLAVLVVVIVLGFFIPSLAVQVRRLHDQDRSGWWILLGFIPYVGGLIMLIFMLIPGTVGINDYGADPKGPDAADLADVFR